jgi:serine/threonine protein kinase/Tfp pilus assembly protein PilF
MTPLGAEPESAIAGPVADRYDVRERIAKGGMGIVYRAHDRVLNRTVALKIIRSRFLERPDLLRRFLAEARISGRLQHPGIVPVYEVGTLPDNRPFIAMKLIEGRTLSLELRDRPSPTHNLPHFLKVFEALCQTMAYAHQQGVIHRDLKPDNVMVGEFGEVQVMDWGLAKYLDPSAAVAPAPDGFEAVERSAFLSGDGTTPLGGESQTMATAVVPVGPDGVTPGYTTAGEVFGTLPYMPPEQARGEADRVDRRGDVFSLGAILCQILTGQPPYFGEPETLKEQARGGKLLGAYILLDRCGQDHCLVSLAKQCLAADPDDRPADAGVLAALMTRCLESQQDQKRAIEVKRLTAEARLAEAQAREQLARRARRLSRALAVAGVMVAGLFAAGIGWYSNDRTARAQDDERRRSIAAVQIDEALAEADGHLDQARNVNAPPVVRDAAARQALSACQRAGALIATTPGTSECARGRFEELRAKAAETERGTRVTVALESWRAEMFDARGHRNPRAGRESALVLSELGIDADGGDPEVIAANLKAHPAASNIRAWLVDAFAAEERDSANRKRYGELVRLAWGEPLGGWMQIHDGPRTERTLLDHPDAMPASWLIVLGGRHLAGKLIEHAEYYLSIGVRRFPADFTLNAMYGSLLRQKPDGQADAVRYLTVARTARPNDLIVQKELGLALAETGRTDEAIELLKAAVTAEPKWVEGHTRLGELLEKRDTEAARASYRKAIEIDAKHTPAHLGLARTEIARGDLGAAESAFRAAIAEGTHKGLAHAGLGQVHLKRWEASKAVAEYRAAVEAEPRNVNYRLGLIEALRISNDLAGATREAKVAARVLPKSAVIHRTLGELCQRTDDRMGAVAAYRAALRFEPADADTYWKLAGVYETIDDPVRAADAYQAVAELKPDDAKAQLAVARTRERAGDHRTARESYRRAVELAPADIEVRRQFARYLTMRDDESAIEHLTAAVKAKPDDAALRVELGGVLATFGRFRESAAALRLAAERLPSGPERDAVQAQARTATRFAGLVSHLPKVLVGDVVPSTPAAWADFGEVARRTKRYAAAARCYARAAEGDGRYAGPAAVCAALAGFGKGTDAESLSERSRAELRQSALATLRQSRSLLADSSIANLKDEAEMDALPTEERAAWRSLWSAD